MLSLILYFLCVYIVFKGVEICQIALMGTNEHRKLGLVIGILSMIGAVATALIFGYLTTMMQVDMEKRMQQIPNLNF